MITLELLNIAGLVRNKTAYTLGSSFRCHIAPWNDVGKLKIYSAHAAPLFPSIDLHLDRTTKSSVTPIESFCTFVIMLNAALNYKTIQNCTVNYYIHVRITD